MKPIVKYELKKGVSVAIILSIISIFIWFISFEQQMMWTTDNYIDIKLGNGGQINSSFMDIVMSAKLFVVALGMNILVSMQFKNEKDTGTGDFIAALPYTQKQRFYNKMLTGIMVVFVTFIVSMITGYVLYGKYGYYQEVLYKTSLFDNEIRSITSFASVALVILNVHIVIFLYYLLLVIVQYSVKSSKVGLIIGTLIPASAICILQGMYMYFDMWLGRGNISYYSLSVQQDISNLMRSQNFITDLMIIAKPVEDRYVKLLDNQYTYIRCGISKNYIYGLIVLILAVVVLFSIANILASKYGLRWYKRFFVNKPVEVIFQIVTTICSTFIPFYCAIIIKNGTENYDLQNHLIITTVAMIIAAFIGYLISHKIVEGGRG